MTDGLKYRVDGCGVRPDVHIPVGYLYEIHRAEAALAAARREARLWQARMELHVAKLLVERGAPCAAESLAAAERALWKLERGDDGGAL